MGEFTIGLDIAKSVFQIHSVEIDGAVVIRKRVSRAKVLEFLAALPPCLVGIEACPSAHHWSRKLRVLSHAVKLMPPSYVNAYLKRKSALRPQPGRWPQPCAGPADARSDAGRAAHRGVFFPAIFLDRILVALVDNHGVAASAQRDRVSALHDPLPIFVRRPVGHDGRDAHAHQPAPSVHRAAGRMAAPARRKQGDC
jgi:hypothetical protein